MRIRRKRRIAAAQQDAFSHVKIACMGRRSPLESCPTKSIKSSLYFVKRGQLLNLLPQLFADGRGPEAFAFVPKTQEHVIIVVILDKRKADDKMRVAVRGDTSNISASSCALMRFFSRSIKMMLTSLSIFMRRLCTAFRQAFFASESLTYCCQ